MTRTSADGEVVVPQPAGTSFEPGRPMVDLGADRH
jgi:hypothetical protein